MITSIFQSLKSRKRLYIASIYLTLESLAGQPCHALVTDSLEHERQPEIETKINVPIDKIFIKLHESQWEAQATENNDKQPIVITKIEVKNSTIFGAEEFDPLIKPLEGQPISEESVKEVATQITRLYLSKGYITSQAIYQGKIIDGVAQIEVIEGGLEEINVEGSNKLTNYIRQRVELAAGPPLNVTKLEEQLLLLQEDPRFESFTASIRPPEQNSNQSILDIRVKEANNFVGSIGINNYSPPSIGATLFNLNLGLQALTELGDSLFISYSPALETFTGTYSVDLIYQVPLNPTNGTLSFRSLIYRNEIIDGPASVLDITGESELYQIRYRQPLMRTPNEEFALSFGFDYQRGQNFAFQGTIPFLSPGSDLNGETLTSVIIFGQDYLKRDEDGAWGLRSQFNIGTYLFGATKNNFPFPDGSFFSWLGQLQRVQVLSPDNTLLISVDLQLSPNVLLTSQQFVIGGAQSVRGYRQNVVSGDNGARFSIEDRIVLVRNEENNSAVFTLAPFFDLGAVWNSADNPTPIILNRTVIAGLGLAMIWQPIEGLNIRLDYAPPLMNLNLRGNNVQDYGFYFSTSYRF